MSLIYRGRKFDTHNTTAQTVSTTTGTYRGASVQFRQAAKSDQTVGTAKQYRGVTY